MSSQQAAQQPRNSGRHARQPHHFSPSRATGNYATDAPTLGRIPVLEVSPVIEGGRWPAKAVPGQVVPITARVFREGHDAVGATLVLRNPEGAGRSFRMRESGPGIDTFIAEVQASTEGDWSFKVEGWDDPLTTWKKVAAIKIPAGLDIENTFAIGEQLFLEAAQNRELSGQFQRHLKNVATQLAHSSLPVEERLSAALSDETADILEHFPLRKHVSTSPSYPLRVERTTAGIGAWYELFPRSVGATPSTKRAAEGDGAESTPVSGTFLTAATELPRIAEMGFTVVYLPPIHPIGVTHRKGPNNTLVAGSHDPGSPWAIGSDAGGHDAIHPDLGSFEDFETFITKATAVGLEVAIDLALQASPDHPWVSDHPEWFTTLPDGSIAYAENPPKKYQDIYPINFDNDPQGISQEVLRIVKFWISKGITVFRVDNPHTKPFAFWEWLLDTIRHDHPEVVFLSEAFSRPAVMHTLAKLGFHQSYTYFTWRNTKEELSDYLEEVSHESSAFLRPNFFVNTPDILTEYLQTGGHAAFYVRAAIAATSSPLWGMYSGFELFESVPRPGAEEYIDNEKYELRPRDYAGALERGESLQPFIAQLNHIRATHPALLQLQNLQLHYADNENVLVFSKRLEKQHLSAAVSAQDKFVTTESQEPHDDVIIVVVNVDPHNAHEATVHLDLNALGISEELFEAKELLTGETWTWGAHNYVRLDPHNIPVHIIQVRPQHEADS